MRLKFAALLMAAVAPVALAQQPSDDSIIRGLLNLATMQQLATAMDYHRVVHGTYETGTNDAETAAVLSVDVAQIRDPWGTPYRITIDKSGYRIAGAGSDRTFDEGSLAMQAETNSLAADSVIVNGKFLRTNRKWLEGFVTTAQKSEQSLATAFPRGDVYRVVNTVSNAWAWLRIQDIEAEGVAKNDPKVVDLIRERITQDKIKALSERFLKARVISKNVRGVRIPRVVDEWGTALEISYVDPEAVHFRIISAGADKVFNRDTWSKPVTASVDEDLIWDDSAWTRVLDLDTLAQAFLPMELQAHPSLTKLKTTTGQQIYKVGGDVLAPVALMKSDVPYPPELEGARKIGVAEVTIDAEGKVIEVKPMLGLSPAADRMIADAISRWEFRPATRAGQPVAVIYSVTLSLAPH